MSGAAISTIAVTPFPGQRPGTSGLRKKTREFMQPGYLEAFVQSVFDAMADTAGGDFGNAVLVVGGDGRYYNREAIQKIIRIAIGNRFGRVMVARDGLLSTPAMSAVIRRRGAFGGLILSASHNPGGLDADFGIKYNTQNGGPAPEEVTGRVAECAGKIRQYYSYGDIPVDVGNEGRQKFGGTIVEVFDPLADYTSVMAQLFDFDVLRALFSRGFRMTFDAMHGVTGPYAVHILEKLLGAPPGTVVNREPLEDFGGHHPDPNLVHAAELVNTMESSQAPDLGAAVDGDGDRNMILGRGLFITPGDSLAVIAEHARQSIPGYRAGLAGIARSMPTSTAADRVARSLDIPLYETPTGWKFFGSLMDAGLCTLCGEESFGTGSNHVREKDGFWAVLCWLSILCATGKSVEEIMRNHWSRFGRSYFQRHDYEGLPPDTANAMLNDARAALSALEGKRFGAATVVEAGDFSYIDPVNRTPAPNAGIRILLDDGSRVVFRLSGTGTEGATLRVYLEQFSRRYDHDPAERVAPLAKSLREFLKLKQWFHRVEPDVVT